jgi:hypothetical protein
MSRRSSRRSSSTTLPRAGSSSTTSPSAGSSSTTPRRLVVNYSASRRLVIDYFTYAARPGASARRASRRRLLRLRRASRCLGTSRGSSGGSSSTTSPHTGSSSTISPTSRIRVPRHVTRLVVDSFTYAVHPVASVRRAAHRAACRRLLRLRRAFWCLGTSRGTSRGSSSTTPTSCVSHWLGSSRCSSSTTSPMPRVRMPRLVALLAVDYFAYVARPGSSARRVAHHAARCRLVQLRRASGCLGTSRGSSHGSSSTTSTTPRVRVPRHVARLVAPLVVDYFAYAVRPGASARRAARHRLLQLCRVFGCLGTSRGSLSTSSATLRVWVPRHVAWPVVDYFASRRLVVDYFAYAARSGASARRAARHAARRRLLRLRRVSGCLGTSRGSSRRSSSTTSPRVQVPRHVARLVVDYSVRHDFVLRPH